MNDTDRLGARRRYVDALIANYLRLPGTPLRASRSDRRLAAVLHDRGVLLRTVYAAFVLAGSRRCLRSPTQNRLDSIRTLYYFLGAIDDVLHTDPPLDPGYINYLAEKIRPLVDEKDALLRPKAEPAGPSISTRGQKTAFPHVR